MSDRCLTISKYVYFLSVCTYMYLFLAQKISGLSGESYSSLNQQK